MLVEVREICEGTKTTLQKIIDSEPAEKAAEENATSDQLKAQYATLDKDLSKILDRLHQQMDRMQLDVKDSIQLIMDYKKSYEDTYQTIPIEGLVQKEKTNKKVTRAKPIDNQIVSNNKS